MARPLEPRLIHVDLKPFIARAEPLPGNSASWPQILRLAQSAAELFQLASPYAPGLTYVGALARIEGPSTVAGMPSLFSAGGSGLDLASALGACIGEMTEYAS